MTANGGKTKVIFWLVAFIQAVGLGVVGYWVGRVERVEAKIESHEKDATRQWIEFEGRMSRNEEAYNEIIRRLDHIERVVDTKY